MMHAFLLINITKKHSEKLMCFYFPFLFSVLVNTSYYIIITCAAYEEREIHCTMAIHIDDVGPSANYTHTLCYNMSFL